MTITLNNKYRRKGNAFDAVQFDASLQVTMPSWARKLLSWNVESNIWFCHAECGPVRLQKGDWITLQGNAVIVYPDVAFNQIFEKA
jgi:hypothetical protein